MRGFLGILVIVVLVIGLGACRREAPDDYCAQYERCYRELGTKRGGLRLFAPNTMDNRACREALKTIAAMADAPKACDPRCSPARKRWLTIF